MNIHQFIIMTLLLACMLILSPYQNAASAAEADCTECHSEILEREKRSRYVHSPFLKENCVVCHVVGYQPERSVKRSPRLVEKEQLERINWFRDSRAIDQEHWVLLPESKISGDLYFKAWDGQARTPLRSISLPPVASLPTVAADLGSPAISAVRVADVRRGISTSVTIRWETDRFTDSGVVFGIDALNSSGYDGTLSRRHQLVLVGLDADTTYRYQVVVRDLFGNRSETQIRTFRTDKTFIEADRQLTAPRFVGQDISVNVDVFRHQQSYLLIFKVDRPVSLSLGVEQFPSVQGSSNSDDDQQAKQAAAGTGHPLLKSRLDTNITVCYDCHSSFKGSYSHPVNVFPPVGMLVPAEYPLLPDGRISCMTCHTAHGANIEFRLLKNRKKELCLGCHDDY